ncbi:DUF1489 domain-containing protein [Fertoebacter nigrum]|uniref:DUF1489 domain-containing protein n=1 Tax=Fertoeibacter niger TaxID=2656921 RepID=A0A8X8H0M5_9RHOB|nr:DUF1489 domain-containing protein [Fertoeibacter niger]NUB46617.1 DUF1489 domain-containing protein [Fertoeibacter niger]
MIKLCVGAEKVEDLIDWQQSRQGHWIGGTPAHVTRMWPKRADELLDGGSLYWVFKGVVLARQAIKGLEQVQGSDGITRCAIRLDPAVIRTEGAPRRPFQGWRYLPAGEAPRDLPQGRAREEPLPPELARALAEIGLR